MLVGNKAVEALPIDLIHENFEKNDIQSDVVFVYQNLRGLRIFKPDATDEDLEYPWIFQRNKEDSTKWNLLYHWEKRIDAPISIDQTTF